MRNTEKTLFDRIKSKIESGETDWNNLKDAPPNVSFTFYNNKPHGGKFYREENNYPQIKINSKSKPPNTRQNAFAMAHEYGHCLSDRKNTRDVALAEKFNNDGYILNTHESLNIICEEIRAWFLGFIYTRQYFNITNKVLYIIRAIKDICTYFPICFDKHNMMSKMYDVVVNKLLNYIFFKIDM